MGKGYDNLKKYIIVGILAAGVLSSGIKIMAKEYDTQSKGKIEGMIQFYAEDIQYLKNEINKLIEECGGGRNE